MRRAIFLFVLLAACVPEEPDAFEARLAAGCNTKEACDALYATADARGGRCVSNPNGDDCTKLLADIQHASVLRSQVQDQSATPTADESAQREAEADAEAQINAETGAARSRRGSPPPGTEAGAAAAPSSLVVAGFERTPDWMRNLIHSRIAGWPPGHAHKTGGIVSSRGDGLDALSASDLSAVRAHVEAEIKEVRGFYEQLHAADAATAESIRLDFEGWSGDWLAQLAAEETCRSTPACAGERLTGPLCRAIADRRDALAGIAQERRNPAGVVNLVVLHDLGENVQDADARLKELRPKYAALVHHPFNEASCSKIP